MDLGKNANWTTRLTEGVDLYLYANGAQVLTWKKSDYGAPGEYSVGSFDPFLILLTSVFVDQVQRSIGHNLAKRYVEKTEVIKGGIKGRPIWGKDFCRHPALGKTCRFFELSYQNKLNEAILAGLESASLILKGTPKISQCQELIFQWRGILSSRHHSTSIVDEAIQELTRLTEHYRTPLVIAKAIVERKSTNIFGTSNFRLPTLEFYLPSLFEKFVYRLLSEALAGSGTMPKEQVFDNDSLVDGFGDAYRAIIPDIILYQANNVVGIIDAKFKPRYVSGVPGTKVQKKSRLSNADIYQLFFYQSRYASKTLDGKPPKTAIIAPLFDKDGLCSDSERREVIWAERATEFKIRVLPILMDKVLLSIVSGDPAAVSISFSPELDRFLKDVLRCDLANHSQISTS